MHDRFEDPIDRYLRTEFAREAESTIDDEFVAVVMLRIRKQWRLRHVLLGVAVFVGLAIAFDPLTQAGAAIGDWLASYGQNWQALTATDLFWPSAFGMLMTGGWLSVFNWLSR